MIEQPTHVEPSKALADPRLWVGAAPKTAWIASSSVGSIATWRTQPELGQARTQFDNAQKAMQQGNWANFGQAMAALKRSLAEPAQSAVQQ
jgi:hypothetical protein